MSVLDSRDHYQKPEPFPLRFTAMGLMALATLGGLASYFIFQHDGLSHVFGLALSVQSAVCFDANHVWQC